MTKKYTKHDESRCDLHVATFRMFRWLRVSRTGKYGTWESRGLSKYTRQHTTSRFPLRSKVFSKFPLPEILFQIGNPNLTECFNLTERRKKSHEKGESTLHYISELIFTFQLVDLELVFTWRSQKKSLPLHRNWRCRFKKAPWFLNLRRFWRLVFPTDYLRHGDFTGLRRLMGSPCTLYTVTLIDTVKKRSKWERHAFLKGSVQSKGWKVGRRGLPSRSVLALHSELL